jgi:outer membrane protein assembly factor BamB
MTAATTFARRLAAPLALVVLVVGCGTLETGNDRVNPDKPLWFHRPNGALQVLYTRPLTAPARAPGEPHERGRAEIDPFHSRVFVGSSDQGLYALRASSGNTLWRFETMGSVQAEPLYDAQLDAVYFGSNDGALYALHASDGQLIWRFANGADNLFAIDRRSAQTLWRAHRTPALGMEISGYAGPAFDNGTVFFAYSDGHVAAYDARDGSERWPPVDLSAEAEQAHGSESLRYLDVDTTPVPADLGAQGHVVFVASYAGGVYALDAERGVPLWKDDKAVGVTELSLWRERAHMPKPDSPEFVPGGPAVPERSILLASGGASGLWAIEPATGATIWRVPIPEGGVTAPAAIAGALLVGTTSYGAFLLSPLDGRPIDGFDLGTGFSQSPAAYGDRAFLLTNAGTFLAVQVETPSRGSL